MDRQAQRSWLALFFRLRGWTDALSSSCSTYHREFRQGRQGGTFHVSLDTLPGHVEASQSVPTHGSNEGEFCLTNSYLYELLSRLAIDPR